MTTDHDFRALADDEYQDEGRVEIDDNAVVSRGGSSGAYVAAWVWVYDPRHETADGDEEFPTEDEPGDRDSLFNRGKAEELLLALCDLVDSVECEDMRFLIGDKQAKELVKEFKENE